MKATELMQLPLKERRRIMRRQANAFAKRYPGYYYSREVRDYLAPILPVVLNGDGKPGGFEGLAHLVKANKR